MCPLKAPRIATLAFSARFQPQRNLSRTPRHCPFSYRKSQGNFCFLFCFFSLAKGAIFFFKFFTARNIEPRRLRRVAAAAACRAATAELYGYTPLHTSSFVVVSNAVVWSPCRTLQNQSETRKVAFCLNLFRSFSVYHFVHAFEHAMGFVSKLCLRFVSVQ